MDMQKRHQQDDHTLSTTKTFFSEPADTIKRSATDSRGEEGRLDKFKAGNSQIAKFYF